MDTINKNYHLHSLELDSRIVWISYTSVIFSTRFLESLLRWPPSGSKVWAYIEKKAFNNDKIYGFYSIKKD